MGASRGTLPGRSRSAVAHPDGLDVLRVDELPLAAADVIRVVFESVRSPWRQGVWLGTVGTMVVRETSSSQFVLWQDTAPVPAEIVCEETDGSLRLYNVWDSGRGRSRESLSATSGMAVEELADGWRRYGCNDIGVEPDFAKVVFRLQIVRRP